LISTQTVPGDDWNAGNIDEMLAYYRDPARVNRAVEFALSNEQLAADKGYAAKLEFALHMVPFGAAADNFSQAASETNAERRQKFLIEGTISAVGDLAFVAPLGVAVKVGKTAAFAASVQRNVRIGAAVTELGLSGVRTAQGAVALYNDDGAEAAGYFGEALLRLMGATPALVAEIKAARVVKGGVGGVRGVGAPSPLRETLGLPVTRQPNDRTCVPSSLDMLLEHYQPRRSATAIEYLEVGVEGMEPAAIKGFVSENLDAIGKEMATGTFDQAAKTGEPFIALVGSSKQRHAVLVQKIEIVDGKQWIVVRDPSRGPSGGAYREPLEWFKNHDLMPTDRKYLFQAIWAQ
jgi:hypothetical protein